MAKAKSNPQAALDSQAAGIVDIYHSFILYNINHKSVKGISINWFIIFVELMPDDIQESMPMMNNGQVY